MAQLSQAARLLMEGPAEVTVERQKGGRESLAQLITMVDHSELGWAVVAEYEAVGRKFR